MSSEEVRPSLAVGNQAQAFEVYASGRSSIGAAFSGNNRKVECLPVSAAGGVGRGKKTITGL